MLAEEDWGDGLKVLTTYKPKECQYKAQNNDIVHYHYVGRLGNDGQVFGQRYVNNVLQFAWNYFKTMICNINLLLYWKEFQRSVMHAML